MPATLGKRVKRAARSALLRGAIYLLAFLPLRAALAFGAAVGIVAWHLARKARRLTLAHLAAAFPERSEPERHALARATFIHLGRAAGEIVAIRSCDADLERYVEIDADGERLLAGLMARGRGMVFVTGHLGNWELLARRIARAGVPNAVIAKAGTDAKLNALAARFRASGGVTTLWRDDPATSRAIIRTFREGKALGILIDQDTRVQGVFVPFFGRLAHTPRAAGDLALRFRAPVVVGSCRRRGPCAGDGHLLELTEVAYDPDPPDREVEVVRITAACTELLEKAIRRAPAEWVWMHERWKTRPPVASPLANLMPKSRELSSG